MTKGDTADMLLENKVAVVYGAGGPIGRAIAEGFAAQGARVYLAGRTRTHLEPVAEAIRAAGGTADTAHVDAQDEHDVDAFVDNVLKEAGDLHISANVIGYEDVHQPLLEISLDDFLQPIVNASRTQFLTTRAAARHMVTTGDGVIITFGGSGNAMAGLGGFKVALDAVEGLRRQWACELGPRGIRLVTLRTGGIPESLPDSLPDDERAQITSTIDGATLLNRSATLADVGNVAAFAASDLARSITGTEINMTCGAVLE
ncbi:SDR family NAD(P)-dependent oxidoreductase [Actinoplanes siamensis]|uniref:3-oxoacyl-ACP reductase n=1 Tax=Actinoplanes siamensis TaxID=1223317 RepID=A0A919NA36_9ACTN|nr:SDR family oxidoreductase [Actinoplanes siamensis]GIF07025.1 3-oxoacyl-ACP reductase [Actinoplanes siamensis]